MFAFVADWAFRLCLCRFQDGGGEEGDRRVLQLTTEKLRGEPERQGRALLAAPLREEGTRVAFLCGVLISVVLGKKAFFEIQTGCC